MKKTSQISFQTSHKQLIINNKKPCTPQKTALFTSCTPAFLGKMNMQPLPLSYHLLRLAYLLSDDTHDFFHILTKTKMKKQTLFLLTMCLVSLLQAQIPNADFEKINPDGTLQNWGNVYIFSVYFDSLGNSFSDDIVYDEAYMYAASSEAHSGTSALRLSNAYNATTDQVIVASVSVDEDSVFTAWGGGEVVPLISYRPESFRFYYKFHAVNPDSAYASLVLYNNMGVTIGIGEHLITQTQAVYRQQTVPITYYTNEEVAAYTLNFGTFYTTVGCSSGPNLGNRLWIDDVSFQDAATGIEDEQNLGFQLYPNPTQTSFRIESPSEILSISIQDLAGKSIDFIQKENNQVEIPEAAAGLYVVKITTKEGISSQKLMLN
jgi:Secretion system C-terminal sorting domain